MVDDIGRVGQEAIVRGSPPQRGVVTKVLGVDQETMYEVFLADGSSRRLSSADVVLLPETLEARVVGRNEFLRNLLLFKLARPFSDILYSYRGTRTSFEVYQFKPVLKYFGSDRRSLLIADEVGLGKTIEAALIYLELKARADLPRVLIACPSALRDKWRSELKLRFDEDFDILDTRGLRRFLGSYRITGGLARMRAIVSLEMIRKRELQDELVDSGLNLDLLIVDEAHHLRNPSTETHRVGRRLADTSDNVLLLTATPLQTGTDNLFNLLQLLEPGVFDDFSAFELQLAPNVYVNAAIRALSEHPPNVGAAVGHIARLQRYPWMASNAVLGRIAETLRTTKPLEAQDAAWMRRDLLELNSIAYLFTRTKKRDVANAAVRTANTVLVTLNQHERRFYDAMLAYVRREVARRGQGFAAFAMVTRERQAASCLIATRRYLEETLSTRKSAIEYEDSSLGLDEEADEDPKTAELTEIDRLLALSTAVGNDDSKLQSLLELLGRIQNDSAGSKVLVFSFFRKTLAHLAARLQAEKYQVFMIHGGVAVAQRQVIMDTFRSTDQPAILLSSEVGAEGLDFQFCDTLVNYDLPWNPMKVEQRIGRIDRYGQLSPKIRIFNLLLDDTIETRILERLYARIRIFEESIGDLEPIIGPEITQLTDAVIGHALTAAQEEALVHQTEMQIETKRLLEQDFEHQKAQLMAPDSLFLSEVNEAVTEGRVVAAGEVAAILEDWLADQFPASRLVPVGDGAWHLSPDPGLTSAYRSFLAGLPDRSEREVEMLARMSSKNGVPCTFDADLANHRRTLEFLHVRHALVRTAVAYYQKRATSLDALSERPVARLRVASDDLPVGRYAFFLHALHVDAVNGQLTFVPIALNEAGDVEPEVGRRLVALFQGDTARTGDFEIDWIAHDSLRSQHESAIAKERARVQAIAEDRNEALIQIRGSSTARSFEAKIRKRREWLLEAHDERIVRMRYAEIANLERQRDERLADLESKRRVVVSYELVAEGVVDIVPAGVSTRPGPTPSQAGSAPVAEALHDDTRVILPVTGPGPVPVARRAAAAVTPKPIPEPPAQASAGDGQDHVEPKTAPEVPPAPVPAPLPEPQPYQRPVPAAPVAAMSSGENDPFIRRIWRRLRR